MNAIKTYHNTHLFHIQCSSKLENCVLCSVSVARCFSRAPNSCRSQPDLADNQNKLLRSIILSELRRLGKVGGIGRIDVWYLLRIDSFMENFVGSMLWIFADWPIFRIFIGSQRIASYFGRIAVKIGGIAIRIDFLGWLTQGCLCHPSVTISVLPRWPRMHTGDIRAPGCTPHWNVALRSGQRGRVIW